MFGVRRDTRSRQRMSGLAVTGAAAIVIGITAVASGSTTQPQPTPPSAGAGAAQLAVLARPASPADTLPAAFGAQLQAWDGSVSPQLASSRHVIASDGQSSYLVPTSDGSVCVINTNENFCSPAARSAGASAVDLCSPSLPLGEMEIEWLLPDHATNVHLSMSDGSSVSFPPGNNVYITRLPLTPSSPVPSSVDWWSGGQANHVATPLPPDARTATCEHPTTPAASSARLRRKQHRRAWTVTDRHPKHLPGGPVDRLSASRP
jgi:hypothetical protein